MKKLTIILGGTFGIYSNFINCFDKNFKVQLERISNNKLVTKIKDTKVEVILAYNTIRDYLYYRAKLKQRKVWKELVDHGKVEQVLFTIV